MDCDPNFTAIYLDEILAQGDQGKFMLAIRQIAIKKGGIAKVAKDSQLNNKSIYRTLSDEGNPDLRNLLLILRSVNLRLAIKPIDTD